MGWGYGALSDAFGMSTSVSQPSSPCSEHRAALSPERLCDFAAGRQHGARRECGLPLSAAPALSGGLPPCLPSPLPILNTLKLEFETMAAVNTCLEMHKLPEHCWACRGEMCHQRGRRDAAGAEVRIRCQGRQPWDLWADACVSGSDAPSGKHQDFYGLGPGGRNL